MMIPLSMSSPSISVLSRSKSDVQFRSIGHGATISAPHMVRRGPLVLSRNLTLRGQHAHALENLLPSLQPGATVLDVGSGSGYLCAVLHHLVSPTHPEAPQGKIIGIDHIPELVEWSKRNLINDGLGHALDDGKIVMVAGDGRLGK